MSDWLLVLTLISRHPLHAFFVSPNFLLLLQVKKNWVGRLLTRSPRERMLLDSTKQWLSFCHFYNSLVLTLRNKTQENHSNDEEGVNTTSEVVPIKLT